MKPMTEIQKTIYDLALSGLLPSQIHDFLEKQDISASPRRILEILALARANAELARQIQLAKAEARTCGLYRTTVGGPFTGSTALSHPSPIAPPAQRPAPQTGR